MTKLESNSEILFEGSTPPSSW